MRVVCGDLESHMVRSAAGRIKANGWNAEAVTVDAQVCYPIPGQSFHAQLDELRRQVIPDTTLVVRESFRVLQPGGKLGITTWTSPGWLESFTTAVPGFVVPPVFVNGPMASKESIISLLSAAGFTHVDVQHIKFEHTDSMSRQPGFLTKLSPGDQAAIIWTASMSLDANLGAMITGRVDNTMRAGEDLRGQPGFEHALNAGLRWFTPTGPWESLLRQLPVLHSTADVWGARAVYGYQHCLTFLPLHPPSSPLAASSEFSVRFESGPPLDIRHGCRLRPHPACASPLLGVQPPFFSTRRD
ncbi:hypothetical protein C8R44DRAFT_868446 [Mycena epipterygia]|nr:hypothetical protein C8R44DRAFT_868446 [Mycena epipterygia]